MGYKVVKGSSGCPSINTLILHSLIIRKGNIEGTPKPEVVVGSWCGKDGTHLPSSDGAPDTLSSSLWISSRLGIITQDAEAEKGRKTWDMGWASGHIFNQACLNSLVAAKINVPLILCGFLCHSVKVPCLLSLVCPPGLMQWSAARKRGRVLEVAALALSLPSSAPCALVPRDPFTRFDTSSFVGGSSGGTCLWDTVEASENFLWILAHYSFLFGVFLSWALFRNSLELPFKCHCSPVLLHFLLTYKHKATSLKQIEQKTFLILPVTFFSFF